MSAMQITRKECPKVTISPISCFNKERLGSINSFSEILYSKFTQVHLLWEIKSITITYSRIYNNQPCIEGNSKDLLVILVSAIVSTL